MTWSAVFHNSHYEGHDIDHFGHVEESMAGSRGLEGKVSENPFPSA